MDFKTWNEQNQNSKQTTNQNNTCSNKIEKDERATFVEQNISSEEKEKMEEKINTYMGKSEDELMKEMFSTASKLKGEGKLKASDMEDFYNKTKGFLTAEQLTKLRSLIDMLGV